MNLLEPGCWVNTTRYGECVLITHDTIQDRYVIRYEAEHMRSKQTLWVLNSLSEVTFSRPPDDVSRAVLALEGPYGLGEGEHSDDPRFHPNTSLPST